MNLGIILIANNTEHQLDELTRDRCHALLTVVGKPIIEHSLELATDLAPDQVAIVAEDYDIDLAAEVGDGDRWGLNLEYHSHPYSMHHDVIAARYGRKKFRNLLVIDADRIRNISSNCTKKLIDFARPGKTHLRIEDASVGITLYKTPGDTNDDDIRSAWNGFKHWDQHDLDLKAYNNEICQYPITTPAEYLFANTDIVECRPVGISFRGRECNLNVFCGANTRLSPKTTLLSNAVIGRHCDIHTTARFEGSVVIDDSVVIARHTRVENSLIMANTYVGEHLDIRNSIVCKNSIINTETNDVLTMTDDFLLADLTPDLYNTYFAQITHQAMGLLFLLLTLPLWPIAAINAAMTSDAGLIRKVIYQGNSRNKGRSRRRLFGAWEFNSSSGILRKLPLLISVTQGHIRLIGVSLYTPSELSRRPEKWKRIRNDLPVGLLGPTQLFLGTKAPIEERLISDAMYKSQRSYLHSWQIMVECLKRVNVVFVYLASNIFELGSAREEARELQATRVHKPAT